MRSRESRSTALRLAGAALAAFLLPASGIVRAQGYLLREFRSFHVDDKLGLSVAGIGDANADGVPDYLVAAPRDAITPGYVRCYSGADATPLYEVSEAGGFGRALAAAGDLDGDGIQDFVVGAPLQLPSNQGRVTVWSGADGAPLLAIDGVAGSSFGWSVDGCGDLDGDGVPDFVVGSPRVSLTGFESWEGAATVHSGATGNLLLAVLGAAPDDLFGSDVAGVGDVGIQDGVPDLLVGAPRQSSLPSQVGYAKVLSGSDGSAIFTIGPSGWSIAVSMAVAGLSDLDGDGVGEFAVGDPNVGWPGFLQVFSGATGAGLFSSTGPPGTGEFGSSIADAGDANGDGVPDVVVGAPFGETVQLFSGATGAPLLTVQGTSGLNYGDLGESVAGVGDIDGDGKADFIAGAPNPAGGYARVYSGSTGATLATVDGIAKGFLFGKTVAGLGDLDGDGVREVLVADTGAEGGGEVYRHDGASGDLHSVILGLFLPVPSYYLGLSVADAGDVDADGTSDLLVGATTDFILQGPNPGSAWVLSGATGAVLFSAFGGNGHRLGFSVAGPGDVNGDGHADLLVGSPGYPGGISQLSAGRAQLFSGQDGAVLFTIDGVLGPLGAEQLGYAVDGVGDVNGDGIPDFIVGAPIATAGGLLAAGNAKVHSGADASVLHLFEGTLVSDRLGSAVAGLGDWDGDGVPEVAVAAPSFQNAGLGTGYPGYVKVFSGAGGELLRTFAETVGGALFGNSIADVGDVNGDGTSDLGVGAPGWFTQASTFGAWRGRMRVFSGLDGLLLLQAAGDSYDVLGDSVAGAGDANGDGFDDVLVGAPRAWTLAANFPNPGAGYVRVLSYAGIPEGSSLFGSGCPGSGGLVPRILTGGGTPTVSGNPDFRILLSKTLGGTYAVLTWGISAPTWLGIPLPLDLGFLGLAGCSLHVPAFQFVPTLANGSGPGEGRGSVAFPILPIPAYAGISLDLQWYVVDPGPALVPGAMSEALRLVLVP